MDIEDLMRAIQTATDPSFLASEQFSSPTSAFYLCRLLDEKHWQIRAAIRACHLERSYGYQIFNGTRPPTRTILLRLALVLALDIEETQKMLILNNKAVLYPRRRFDAAVLYGLSHRLALEETDELLRSLGECGLL